MSNTNGTTQARFVTGSILNHVLVTTLTGAIGLMALFLVDFADLYFLSLLGKTEITSAIGFAGTIAFTSLSISIGIGIAAAALVARNLGAGNVARARRFATSTLAVSAMAPLVVTVLMNIYAEDILHAFGARGQTVEHAAIYLKTVALGFPLLGAAVCLSFSLRAVGDPKRAMYVTLTTAIGNAILDPIFIFGLDLSIFGAALATICSNLLSFLAGFYGLARVHKFLEPLNFGKFASDLKAITNIAAPATLTQLATPFAIGYMTWAVAPFGDEAVAATAIINRLIPVAFGIIFSLSGAVGPIVGQNFGAGNYGRLRETINKSMLLNVGYTLATAIIIILLSDRIPGWFHAKGETIVLVSFFCQWLAWTWMFSGMQFVAQAAFNNLGKPLWSTFFNWGKSTIGTIPFVHIGAYGWGAKGLISGYSIGAVIFGIAATASIYVLIAQIENGNSPK